MNDPSIVGRRPRSSASSERPPASHYHQRTRRRIWLASASATSPTGWTLDFDDRLRQLATFVDHGWLTNPDVDTLQTLSRLLDEISGQENAALWRGDALAGPEWEHIREQARNFLLELP